MAPPARQPFITLYDTPMSQSNGWAPAMWRIRLILNYKNLAYRTTWVELPDIERTMRSIGAPAASKSSDGRSVYTLPVIVDPGINPSNAKPVVLSNPSVISEYLEITYPARPLFPEGTKALQTLFVHYLQESFSRPLLPIMVPLSASRLPERSVTHFFPPGQRPLLTGAQREQALAAVKDNFTFLASVLDKNNDDGDGTVACGYDLTYADMALAAILIWIERVSPHEIWPHVRSWNHGRWVRLLERCRKYMDVL